VRPRPRVIFSFPAEFFVTSSAPILLSLLPPRNFPFVTSRKPLGNLTATHKVDGLSLKFTVTHMLSDKCTGIVAWVDSKLNRATIIL
jgi:hypothetical protein